MTKSVIAEYDAQQQSLRLAEPLSDVPDHSTVVVHVETVEGDQPPWARLEGSISVEAGDSLAAAIEEMFGSR